MSAGSSFKPFPPGRGELLVPTSSRAAALAGLALFPACRRLSAFAQRVAWTAVRLAGPRALPGRARAWEQPLPEATWDEIRAQWREALGEWEQAAVLRQVQAGRDGLSLLLLRKSRPIAFVKLRAAPAPLTRERSALEAVAELGPTSFAAPATIASGEAGGWYWLAVTPLPPRIHRPASSAQLEPVLDEVDAALGRLARPAQMPLGWRPMHGDMTPWNLRRMPGGGLALVDWEEASWGPAGADRVLFQATEAALGGPAPDPNGYQEAVEYWRRVIRRRGTDARNRRLAAGVDQALTRMASTGASHELAAP